MTTTNNIYGKFLFIECDEIITRALAPFMQFCSRSSSSVIDKIRIDSSSKIDNYTSYLCLKDDLNINMARFEGWKYSFIYPHLDISFNPKPPSTITEKYILSRFGEDINSRSYSKDNYFLITCSSTPKQMVDDIKDIVKTSTKNNYTHIHCEIGNPKDGGMIYCSNGLSDSKHPVSYPEDTPNIPKGDTNSTSMTVQALLGANILFSILVNIISFKQVRNIPVFFNFSKMDIDDSPHSPELMKPIKLLGPKRGKKKKMLDNRFYVLMVGAGALGSNATTPILQIANKHHKKIANFVMVDGDTSERKNLRNQRFLASEIGDFKVNSIINRYSKSFPKIASKLKAIPEYLYKLDEEFLLKAFDLDSIKDKNVIIIGGVDNLPTRRELHYGFCDINKVRNFLYIDSGNGSDERIGQTITGYKQYGKVILNPIASSGFDNGDILNNTEDIKVIGSCSRNIQENPQHQTTSIAAATSLVANFVNPFEEGVIKNHMTFFDAENIFMNSY